MTTPQTTQPASGGRPEEAGIKIVQHSQLFYWWPVWVVGFLLALISWFGGGRLAVLPQDAEIRLGKVEVAAPTKEDPKHKAEVPGYTISVPGDPPRPISREDPPKAGDWASPFPLHVTTSKALGVVFAMTLLLVIVITNVPLRGMWSVVIIVSIVMLSIILWLAGAWEYVIDFFTFLDIRINTGGYFFIASVLFVIWAITVFAFDRQIYMIFTPGQLKVREEIGGGETAYDTRGMVIQHLRDDLFRHWVLGLGSGDLIVRTSGAHSHEFRMSNVLFVGRKLQMIEEMQRDVPVVAGNKV
jgi:hypothetical protein